MKKLKLNEIKNGRLAMLAVFGYGAQVSGGGVFGGGECGVELTNASLAGGQSQAPNMSDLQVSGSDLGPCGNTCPVAGRRSLIEAVHLHHAS